MSALSRPNPRRTVTFRIFLVAGSISTVLIFTEIGIRLYYRLSGAPLYPVYGTVAESYIQNWIERHEKKGNDFPYGITQYDSHLGWKLKPNLQGVRVEDQPPVTTNSRGVRSRREIPYEKPSDITRIVAIGDSYTFGYDGADDEIWPVDLEAQLSNCEVINLGVPGYGMDQQLLMLEREGLRYHPDIVLVGLYEEDMDRNLLPFRDYAKPMFVLEEYDLRLVNVPVPKLEEILARQKDRNPLSFAWHFYQSRLRARWNSNRSSGSERHTKRLALATALLSRIYDLASDRGAKTFVVYIPTDLISVFNSASDARNLERLEQGSGYAFLDLEPTFKEVAQKEGRSVYSGHFNRFGNLVVAEEVRRRLTEKGWVRAADESVLRRFQEEKERVMRAEPTTFKDRLGQAEMLQAEHRLAEAVAEYREVLRLAPNQHRVWNNLGIALKLQGNVEESEKCHREALRVAPDYVEGHYNLGVVLAQENKLKEAIESYRQALRLRPDFLEVRFNLANALARNGDPVEAEEQYRKVLKENPDFADARINLGNLLASRGDYDKAEKEYREVLRSRPNDPNALENFRKLEELKSRKQ